MNPGEKFKTWVERIYQWQIAKIKTSRILGMNCSMSKGSLYPLLFLTGIDVFIDKIHTDK